MLISHVYAVAMKKLHVLLKGMSEPVTLEAEKIVDDDNELTLTAFDTEGKKIGLFNKSEIAGFWTTK